MFWKNSQKDTRALPRLRYILDVLFVLLGFSLNSCSTEIKIVLMQLSTAAMSLYISL